MAAASQNAILYTYGPIDDSATEVNALQQNLLDQVRVVYNGFQRLFDGHYTGLTASAVDTAYSSWQTEIQNICDGIQQLAAKVRQAGGDMQSLDASLAASIGSSS